MQKLISVIYLVTRIRRRSFEAEDANVIRCHADEISIRDLEEVIVKERKELKYRTCEEIKKLGKECSRGSKLRE